MMSGQSSHGLWHLSTVAATALLACGTEAGTEIEDGWSEHSHGKDAEPDYERVFGGDRVLELRLRIEPSDYAAMLADIEDMLGPAGSDPGGSGVPPGGNAALDEPFRACDGLARGEACSFALGDRRFEGSCEPALDGDAVICMTAAEHPPLMGGGERLADDAELLPRTPVFRPCAVEYAGRVWNHVGVRFKGNSTLAGAWLRGSSKLPLRLRFDKFEDEHPETEDQRFYGFQSLSLGNNANDPSFARELLAAEALRAAGVPAARGTLARLSVDAGEGPSYFGLYTLVELPDRPLLDTQLGGRGGNLYKPQGTGARFTSFVRESFEKQTNEQEADYSDVQAAISALNADRTDAAAWRAELERHFDVAGFQRWLAVNTIIGNSDSYGQLAHNYYLYAAPADAGRLHWIPWDHDLAFGEVLPDSLLHEAVDESWPLIRFLLDDPLYRQTYLGEARAFLSGPFATGVLEERAAALHELARPHVLEERPGHTVLDDSEQFETALDGERGLRPAIRRLRDEATKTLAAQ